MVDRTLAKKFGMLVRNLRSEAGLSQEDFADRCNLHRTYIGSIERGEKTVTIYVVQGLGVQPLKYLEVVSVPNGLILFDGPNYNNTKGILIPGKDDQTVTKKRTRVRLDPLATLDPWRCIKIELDNGAWHTKPRAVFNPAAQPSSF